MKIKALIAILPVTMLMACGGGEESEEGTEEGEENEAVETMAYESTFESCEVSSSMMSMTTEPLDETYAFAMEGMNGVDLSAFTTANAELTKDHANLYIKFVNNPDIIDSSIPGFGPGDMSMTLNINAKEGELAAGSFTSEDIKIRLTKGLKEEDASKTKDIGSNKTPKTLTINSISEDHVCGVFTMTTEEGAELISAAFDLDVTLKNF